MKKSYHAIAKTPGGNMIRCDHNPFTDHVIVAWNDYRVCKLAIPVSSIPTLIKLLSDAHRAVADPMEYPS